MTPVEFRGASASLLRYCQDNDWAGYDPYDGLNSRVFTALPLARSRLARLALIQALKRSPVNLRRCLRVPKLQNAKGIALFLSATLKLKQLGCLTEADLPEHLKARLKALRSPGTARWCWGYSFPWQNRLCLVPRYAPNIISTCFAAEALLDFWADTGDGEALTLARSAADYILSDLYWTEGSDSAGFGYPAPDCRTQVHNANLLGAALLARVAAATGDSSYREAARRVARCAVSHQNRDGSWYYGEAASQRWIDSFHTGFNLCALRRLGQSLGTDEFEPAVRSGVEYYRAHFFLADGAPRYFNNETYPLDVHSAAQAIITLTELRDTDSRLYPLAERTLEWTLAHLRDARGYFYYQKGRWFTIRIPYMRWAQAWMLLALSVFLEADASRTLSAGTLAPSTVG